MRHISVDETRRRFLGQFSALGLGGTLLPGVLWAGMQQTGAQSITLEMLNNALAMSGLSFTDEDQKAMLQAVNQSLTRMAELRAIKIPNDVSPPFHFSALVPGMTVNRTKLPFRMSTPSVKRPANLEDVAFWPVVQLAQLIKTRQVTSSELTRLYLDRLHRYNGLLNCVVTICDDLAVQQAKQADAEIAAGRYKGPLHGIPWGAKDIIAAKGYKTTWGSGAYQDQVIDADASVVEMLRDAGAVLVAKLTSGEIAQGDRWGEPGNVSCRGRAKGVQRRRRADEHHLLRAPVRRVGAPRGRQGVSRRNRFPFEASKPRRADVNVRRPSVTRQVRGAA